MSSWWGWQGRFAWLVKGEGMTCAKALRQRDKTGLFQRTEEQGGEGQGQIPDSWCLEPKWVKWLGTCFRGRAGWLKDAGSTSPKLSPASRASGLVPNPNGHPKPIQSPQQCQGMWMCKHGLHAETNWTGDFGEHLPTMKMRMGSRAMWPRTQKGVPRCANYTERDPGVL